MVDKKISELTEITTPDNAADFIPIVDTSASETKKIKPENIGMTASSTATLTNKTIDADGTGNSITNIENADIKAGAAIDLSKLATDPLARANHTGTQTASTISDFDTEVSNNTDVTSKAPLASPTFTGTVTTSAQTINGNTTQGDGYKAIFGNGSDLDIYHTGGNNIWYGNSGNQLFYTPSSTFHRFLVNNVAIVDIESGGIDLNGTLDMAGNNIIQTKNVRHNISTCTTTLDFDNDQLQYISISANTTFADASNTGTGNTKTVKIICDGTLRTLAFPSAWRFVGAKPTDIAASKVAILTLTCFAAGQANVMAAYAVEE